MRKNVMVSVKPQSKHHKVCNYFLVWNFSLGTYSYPVKLVKSLGKEIGK